MTGRRARGERVPEGLADRVVAAAAPELRRLRGRTLRRRAAAGALAATLVGGLMVALRRVPESEPVPDAAVAAMNPALMRRTGARIAVHLMPEGRFDPQSWSGPPSAEVAMHALALLALARADEGAPETRADEVLRGASWLLQQQGADGSFGQPGSGGQDHALATLALLEASSRTRADRVFAGARSAVAYLAAHETPVPTAWTLQALERARALNVAPNLHGPIARARRQLGATLTGDELERAAIGGLGPMAQAEFGELPAAAAELLAAVAMAH